MNWNYTSPLDILALLPGWGPEDSCEAGQHRCGARLRPALAEAPGGDGSQQGNDGSHLGDQFNLILGACVPSLCQGPALAETFHIIRRAARIIVQERVDREQDPSDMMRIMLRELGSEDCTLANIQVACAGDLLPPRHWRHIFAAGAALAALALAPYLLPRRRPRPAAATSVGALKLEAAADSRLGIADGLRVLAIGMIVLGHILVITIKMGFWNLAGDGSSLRDLLGQGIDLNVGSSMAVQTFNFLSAFFAWGRLLKGREALGAAADFWPYLTAYAVRILRYLPTLLSAYLIFPRLLFFFETSSSPSYFFLSDARQEHVCGAAGLARQIAILFFPYNLVHGERYEGLCLSHGWFVAQDSNLFALTLMLHWGWTRLAGASDRALVFACFLLWASGTARLAMRVIEDDVTVFSLEWFIVEHRAVHTGLGACMAGILSSHMHSRGISFGAKLHGGVGANAKLLGSRGARVLVEWAACAMVLLLLAAFPVAFHVLHRTVPAKHLTIKSFTVAAVWHEHLTHSAAWAVCNKLSVGVLSTTTHPLGLTLFFFLCSGMRTGGMADRMRRALSLDIFTLLAPYAFAIYMTNQLIVVLLIAHAYQQISIPGWKDPQVSASLAQVPTHPTSLCCSEELHTAIRCVQVWLGAYQQISIPGWKGPHVSAFVLSYKEELRCRFRPVPPRSPTPPPSSALLKAQAIPPRSAHPRKKHFLALIAWMMPLCTADIAALHHLIPVPSSSNPRSSFVLQCA